MKKIYKYILAATDVQTISLPENAEILTVQTQNETPCIWVELDPELPSTVTREFRIFSTGHPMIDYNGKYIGTFQLRGGSLVFHLYENCL